jgi:phosphoribosyl 1,2-cyclic phosphodiesterase
MSLWVASLNSGSNGNCYYIGNDDEAVLIDGGISCRETEKRLKRLGLSIKKVKAIFVTHEHGDHIHGVPVLSRRHKLPIYITPGTMRYGNIKVAEELVTAFRAYEDIRIGNIVVKGFPKMHDAFDPHSFIIECDAVKVGVFTDIGYPCRNVIENFKQCHAAFLESNYDEQMLETGNYPIHLKNRIRGGKGHLSNDEAAKLFADHAPGFMSHLFLSHLSRNNNSPKIVEKMFAKIAGSTEIIIASRDKETALYQIKNNPYVVHVKRMPYRKHMNQLSLFQTA